MKNLGLKIILWIPYLLVLLYLAIGLIVLMVKYKIPAYEIICVNLFVVLYSCFMEIALNLRKKYWHLTKL